MVWETLCSRFAGPALHFTCKNQPLSAKQMTKSRSPFILFPTPLVCTQQEGRALMQVKIEVAPEHTPPRAVIYTDRLTPEIQRALDILQAKNSPVLAEQNGRTMLLTPQEIYMVRVEGGETRLYTRQDSFGSRKRLYELHAQLGVMIAKPGYAPCDGNELCFQLGEMDKAQRKAFERYDKFQLPKPTAQPDSAEVFTDNVKTVQNARTLISRGLSRKTQTEESLQKIQNAVDTLFALKQTIKPETMAKLKAIGITIPQG